MKKIELNLLLFTFLFTVFTTFSFAQSDYEMVQNFKMDYTRVEQQIKDADSLADLSLIAEDIEKLKQNYVMQKDLLDKALYPDKFDALIDKLNSAYHLRESDFAAVDVLKTEVSTLKLQVDTLNSKNNELLTSLEKLESMANKNNEQIRQLSNLISNLKSSLHKRDELVMNMVDSLMPPVMREKPMLSTEDKKQITSNIKKDNILANVKTTIRENIKYLDLTSLQPQDISDVLKQQKEFSNTWSRIGPTLAEVYSNNNNKASELREIDSLFTLWKTSVRQEAWNSIEEVFAEKGVPVRNFTDGEEFTNKINQYIEKEKNDIASVTETEAKNAFKLFVDSTWSGEIEPRWTPFLIENGMLAENNKDSIDENIDIWRSELYQSNWWMLIVFLGVIAAGLALLVSRLRKKSKSLKIPTEQA